MPVLNPAEPWKRTGRYEIDELFKLQDRKGADMVLAMTHEEVVTTHVAQVVRSYRDLPLILYHFQTKERDEPRPRAGVLRTREFIMKDSYTFDRDEEGLAAGYEKHVGAYDRIFERTGLEWYRVESDVGMMGGSGAHEYMAPCAAGRGRGRARARLRRQRRGRERRPAAGRSCRRRWPRPRRSTRRASRPSRRSPATSACPPGALLKAYPVIVDGRGLVLVVVRGDHRVNEIKLRNALGADCRPAQPDEFARKIGPAGFIGPVGANAPVLLDAAVTDGGYVTGANRPDFHLRGVEPGRDFAFERADVRTVEAGDTVNGQRDPHRGGDRGRQHLQARHALLASRSARPSSTSRARRSRS